MSFRDLLGLSDMNITDTEIIERIQSAFEHDISEVEFVRSDGTHVVVRLPHIDFVHHIDPWDGPRNH